jgi:hypothetical protein
MALAHGSQAHICTQTHPIRDLPADGCADVAKTERQRAHVAVDEIHAGQENSTADRRRDLDPSLRPRLERLGNCKRVRELPRFRGKPLRRQLPVGIADVDNERVSGSVATGADDGIAGS